MIYNNPHTPTNRYPLQGRAITLIDVMMKKRLTKKYMLDSIVEDENNNE